MEIEMDFTLTGEQIEQFILSVPITWQELCEKEDEKDILVIDDMPHDKCVTILDAYWIILKCWGFDSVQEFYTSTQYTPADLVGNYVMVYGIDTSGSNRQWVSIYDLEYGDEHGMSYEEYNGQDKFKRDLDEAVKFVEENT